MKENTENDEDKFILRITYQKHVECTLFSLKCCIHHIVFHQYTHSNDTDPQKTKQSSNNDWDVFLFSATSLTPFFVHTRSFAHMDRCLSKKEETCKRTTKKEKWSSMLYCHHRCSAKEVLTLSDILFTQFSHHVFRGDWREGERVAFSLSLSLSCLHGPLPYKPDRCVSNHRKNIWQRSCQVLLQAEKHI